MKLVIDIPEKDYDKLCRGELVDTVCMSIKNATPLEEVLEDIKAEFIEYHEIGCDMNCKNCKMVACIEPKDVIADLEIIDNHISGKENE